MAFKLGASVGIKALMDTASVERGASKISTMFDGIARKSKETNVFLSNTTRIMGGLIKLGAAFGATFLGAVTGLVAASPHFKAFLASLKGPWMQLTKFFGETFNPILKLISSKFKEFVDVVTGSKEVRDFFDKWVTKISEFLKSISSEDMKSFVESMVGLADKTIEFALNIGGNLKDILFGSSESKGIIQALLDLPETVTKIFGIETNITEPEGLIAKAILVLMAAKVGGPLLAGAMTGAILAQEGYQATLTPGTSGYKSREDIGLMSDLGRILDNVVTLMTGRDKPLHPGYGSMEGWGETGGYTGGAQNLTIIVEDKTSTGVTTTPKTGFLGELIYG